MSVTSFGRRVRAELIAKISRRKAATAADQDAVLERVDWVYWYKCRIYLTVWKRYTRYQNEYFENAWWHCLDEYFVFFGFAPHIHGWFSAERVFYDGHVCRSASFLGLVVGCGFSYDAQQMHVQP